MDLEFSGKFRQEMAGFPSVLVVCAEEKRRRGRETRFGRGGVLEIEEATLPFSILVQELFRYNEMPCSVITD